jgi:histidine kinase/DNA gyrase B/HSP90-like ATPase
MSERNTGSDRESIAGGGEADPYTLGMKVANIGFLLERMGADCDDLQFLRELTQNSIQAGATTITWDIDRLLHEQAGVYKLSIIDNGHGMTGTEMVQYINQLSSSGRTQALDENFGLGAKIATATRNPEGVIYRSWKGGVGAMIWLWRDPGTGEYGLRQFELEDGRWGYVLPLHGAAKPQQIGRHGTQVTLLGESGADDTMKAPEGAPKPSGWLARHLNARYFDLPEQIELSAREGWEHPSDETHRNQLRRVNGMRWFLTEHSDASGTVEITGCRVHWWLLDDSDGRKGASPYPRYGHAAALHQGELYEMTLGRGGTARLQQFGILFGSERVVLYVEPSAAEGRQLAPNTARTELRLNREPLPYADWALEFRQQMPQPLRSYMDSRSAAARSRDHSTAIMGRLGPVMDLYALESYGRGGAGSRGAGRERGASRSVKTSGGAGQEDAPARFATASDDLLAAALGGRKRRPSRARRPLEPPHVAWVTKADGTRAPDFMEDRAAHWFADQNALHINGDFRSFTSMIEYWCRQYGVEPDAPHPVIIDQVREWCEQQLLEVVLGARALEDEQRWTPDDLAAALSEEALTAVALQRYHVLISVKRGLGAKLGKLQDGDTLD